MRYRLTKTMLVDCDLHQAGDELRTKAEGTIKAMIRAGQLEVMPEAVKEPEIPKVPTTKPAANFPKK